MTQEEQKVQELLKPRYIVENEWFDCPYPNGTILVQQTHCNGFGPEMWIPGQYTFLQNALDKYPYLVRKLSWWEERDASEMPQYVKCIKTPDQIIQPGDILKVTWTEIGGKAENGPRVFPYTNCFEPATSAEYTAYISSPELK